MAYGMNRFLSNSNFYITPGDILLLKSLSGGRLNRLAQIVKSREKASFTHVAIVMNDTQVADAMPRLGVTFRSWRDLESLYDIKNCSVARHMRFSADPDGFQRVRKQATYFVRQPYRLSAALRSGPAVEDMTGVVCSHFVVAVMQRLGIRISRTSPTGALPADIDAYTTRSTEWRRFPLAECALYSQSVPPPDSHDHWKGLQLHHEDVLSKCPLNPLEMEALEREAEKMAGEIVEAARAGRQPSWDGIFNSFDSSTKEVSTFRESSNRDSDENINLRYAVSRHLLEYLELTLLQYREATEKDMRALAGDFLLSEWRVCFLSAHQYEPIFLHDEKWAKLISQHREAFAHAITLLQKRFDLIRAFFESWRACRAKEIADGEAVSGEFFAKAQEAARGIIYLGSHASEESLEVIQTRLNIETALRSQLASNKDLLDQAQWEPALTALDTLIALDSKREFWLTIAQPELSAVLM